MARRPRAAALWIVLGIAGFALVLFRTAIRTTPAPPDLSAEARGAAIEACHRAVREELEGARFPFEANLGASDGEGLQISGSVDVGTGDRAVRRNYECRLRAHPPTDRFTVSSKRIWQSH